MPWQTVPGLAIIGGAFATTGILLRGVDWLVDGKHRRVQIDEFSFNMDKRDKYIKDQVKAAETLAVEEAKKASRAAI